MNGHTWRTNFQIFTALSRASPKRYLWPRQPSHQFTSFAIFVFIGFECNVLQTKQCTTPFKLMWTLRNDAYDTKRCRRHYKRILILQNYTDDDNTYYFCVQSRIRMAIGDQTESIKRMNRSKDSDMFTHAVCNARFKKRKSVLLFRGVQFIPFACQENMMDKYAYMLISSIFESS